MRAYRSEGRAEISAKTEGEEATLAIYDGAGSAFREGVAAEVGGGSASCEIDLRDMPLDTYLCRWSFGAGTVLTLCEAPYFTVDEFRAFDDGSKLSSEVTDGRIADIRSHVEGTFERAGGVAFVPRGARDAIVASGTKTAYRLSNPMPRRILSCTADGSDISGSVRIRGDFLVLARPVGHGRCIDVHYEHGYAAPPDALRHNAMLFADALVGSPSVNPRATGQEMDYGYVKFSVAGKDGATGIPEVDAFLSDDPGKGGFGVRRMVIG